MVIPEDIQLADIRNAASAIEGCVERTPCRQSVTLSGILGVDLYLKFENLQFTASFKERGALIDYDLGEQPYGVLEFGIQDLDDHDIGFGQDLAPAGQD